MQLAIETDVTKQALDKALLNFEQRLFDNAMLIERQRQMYLNHSISRWQFPLFRKIVITLVVLELLVCAIGVLIQPKSFKFFLGLLTAMAGLMGWFFWQEKKLRANGNKKPIKIRQPSKFIQFTNRQNASRFRQSTFKNFDNQPLPFTAIYEFKGNKLTYYRAFENQKKLILNKTIKAKKYDVFDGVVILYPSTWLAFPRLTLFITAENLPILLDYLHELGAKPIRNTDENKPDFS